MKLILKQQLKQMKNICRTLGVKRLYVFGSVVSNDFDKDSDIDFLVSFKDNLSIEDYTNNYFLIHYQFRELFNRNIDIVTESTLSNPYFIKQINETKELIYEA